MKEEESDQSNGVLWDQWDKCRTCSSVKLARHNRTRLPTQESALVRVNVFACVNNRVNRVRRVAHVAGVSPTPPCFNERVNIRSTLRMAVVCTLARRSREEQGETSVREECIEWILNVY